MTQLGKVLVELAQREDRLTAELEKVRTARAVIAELAGEDAASERARVDRVLDKASTGRQARGAAVAPVGATCEAVAKGGCKGDILVHPCKKACGWETKRCRAHSGKKVAGVIGGHMRTCGKQRKVKPAARAATDDDDAGAPAMGGGALSARGVGGAAHARESAGDFDAEGDLRAERLELADADLWWGMGIRAGLAWGAGAALSPGRAGPPRVAGPAADPALPPDGRGRSAALRRAGVPARGAGAPARGASPRGAGRAARRVLHAHGGRRLT